MRHETNSKIGDFKVKLSSPSTFSCVARDPSNGDLGIIVQSKFPAVGSIVPWAQAGFGAIATQAWANASYGPRGLELLKSGMSASDVLEALLKEDDGSEHRQVGIVDSYGEAAAHTGAQCMDWAGHITGKGYTCQGNILAGESVVIDMADAYESTDGDLIDRLFAALKAGQGAGGDRRGMQSAAILVVRDKGGYEGGNDRYVDVRVDDHPTPIDELERVFRLYDLTLLSREDPSQLLAIDGDVSRMIQDALLRLGYIQSVSSDSFPPLVRNALQEWININNFENKWRDDGTIWQSVLDYLLSNANGGE
ncbi:MAG: DUF1028 domain-containing protein [Candidatus Thorarchaeota archaeon]|nr:DUF1028 domain-containing protein [Candidatus Thorarchaeota archaeon]